MKKRTVPPQPQKTLQGVSALILGAIILVACFMRFHGLESSPPGLCYDESINGVNVVEAIETGAWRVFYPDNYGREGLFINIQGAFVALVKFFSGGGRAGIEPWMLRFPSAVFGVLTVAGLYLLAATLTGSRIAASAAALFMATSFWHVNFSRIGFRAIMAPFWLVWSLYFLFAGFREIREGNLRRGNWLAAVSGVCYGLGFHSYIAYRATPVLIVAALAWLGYSMWKAGQRRAALNGIAIFAVAALAVTAPLAAYFVTHPGSFEGRASQLSVLNSAEPARTLLVNAWKTALMFNFEGDGFWRHNIAGRPQIYLPVGLLFLGGLASVVRSLASRPERSQSFPGILLVLWLIAGALPAVFSSSGIPHALRGLLMAPACFLLAGVAAEKAWDWLSSHFSRAAAAACGAAFAMLLIWECHSSYFGTFARSPHLRTAFEVDLNEIAREINALPDYVPKYVVMPAWKPDHRGVPDGAYPLAVVTGSVTAKGREQRRIRFVVARDEAERVSREEGAHIFLIQSH